MKYSLTLLSCILIIGGVFAKTPKREMRAVWIATVANIDWPSKAGLPVAEQKRELTALLDLLRDNGMNTVIFQVRPATDALYDSPYEPWSQWLTGEQGKAPEPLYDPLAFIIEECHKRCMELHAWLNPYRAVFNYKKTVVAPDHITREKPEWFLKYGTHMYFNPGLPETRVYVSKIVADVVRRYDIDAVHFDDYFYPYKIAGSEFPDQHAFDQHPRGFDASQKEEWRRDNVNLIIRQLRDSIKSIKPCMKFGISPFGVWRNSNKDPKGSATRAGQTNYDDLYADILLWMREGWIDYITPQVYWHMGFKVADYKTIVRWWDSSGLDTKLYIGQGAYRLSRESKYKGWHSSRQITRQVAFNRRCKNVEGSMFFSAKSFRNDLLGINKQIKHKVFRYHALVPENGALPSYTVAKPEGFSVEKTGNVLRFSWEPVITEPTGQPRYYVIYRVRGNNVEKSLQNPKNIVELTADTTAGFEIEKGIFSSTKKFVVTVINRMNSESLPSAVVEVKY